MHTGRGSCKEGSNASSFLTVSRTHQVTEATRDLAAPFLASSSAAALGSSDGLLVLGTGVVRLMDRGLVEVKGAAQPIRMYLAEMET